MRRANVSNLRSIKRVGIASNNLLSLLPSHKSSQHMDGRVFPLLATIRDHYKMFERCNRSTTPSSLNADPDCHP